MPTCPQPAQCTEDDCRRPAAPRHKRCWGHLKRVTRKQSLETPLAEPYASPWERLTAAALAYADVEDGDEEAFARARDRLRKAAQAYARSCPARSPPDAVHAARETGHRGKRARQEDQLQLWPEGTG